MIDRIEELLDRMAEDDEDGGQEDVLALTGAAYAAPRRQDGDEVPAPEEDGTDAVDRTADGQAGTGLGPGTEEAGAAGRPEGGAEWPRPERLTRPAPLLPPAEMGDAPAKAGDGPAAGGTGRGGRGEYGPSAAAQEAGLEGLYRQTVRAAQAAAPAVNGPLPRQDARAGEPGTAASLAVDELDRAVRRDSRRYDGEMRIY